MSRRPTVGVTGPERGGWVPWVATSLALWLAGARPRRLTPGRRRPLPRLDGLIIGGGSDVDPRRYGGERRRAPAEQVRRRPQPRPLTAPLRWVAGLALRLAKTALRIGALEIDPARDEMELALLGTATAEGRPVLGICRGAQLINVAFGGSLHQDLRGFDLNPSQINGVLPRKAVEIEPGSRLEQAIGCGTCRVNALNNQAVDRPGEGLAIVARDGDGVAQAIEHRSRPFLIGVQWHPEYLPQEAAQRRLFRSLVEQARGSAAEAAAA